MGITQHWHSPTPAGIPVVWRQDTFVSLTSYTYSLVDITQHWHSPTPAGIPVVWRQDTFVSLTITHTLWWASLNTDTDLHQQESLSFGDRTPLWSLNFEIALLLVGNLCFINYYTYSLVGITQHWHRPTPAENPCNRLETKDTFVFINYYRDTLLV